MTNLLWITAIAVAMVSTPIKKHDVATTSATNLAKGKWI